MAHIKLKNILVESQWPKEIVSKHDIIWRAMKQVPISGGRRGVKYDAIFRSPKGTEFKLDDFVFGSVDELKQFMDNYIISISMYNKLRNK